ncbi:MAG: ABC transporter ATP-binding protein [Bacteroidota bacterium]
MNHHYILQSLQFVWKSSKKWTIYLLVFQLLQAVLPLASLYLIKLMVDTLTDGGINQGFEDVLKYVFAFGGVQLAMAILQNYQTLISETQQQLVTDYMSTVIIDQAVSMDISYYENAGYHDTFHRAQKQAMFRPVQLLRNLTELLRTGFLLLSIAGLLAFLHWGIAFLLVGLALPVAGVQWYYSRKLFEWEKKRTSLEREAHYLNEILTTDAYAKEVRIFNLGSPLKEKFIQVRKALFGEKYRIGQQRASAGFFARTAEIVAMVATYAFITWRTFQGTISVGDLVMYFQAFQKGQATIKQALTASVGLYNNRLFLSHLFELLAVESLLKVPSPPLPTQLQQKITLENVDFAYPATSKKVLKNISLQFQKGQVVALVGENGSGKTSLVKLLCRLYDPSAGTVYWDDQDIRQFELKAVREKISVIYQDFAKYFFSVEENIRLADQTLPTGSNRIQQAAEKSGATQFIAQLPDAYQQQLGRRFKKGAELSGGQWQKIALARAFYKEADLIILDEPSSAIDPLAEATIFDHFRVLAKDKILILVTHRLYNLKMADNIVVLQDGHIVEQGTHDTLVKKKGAYLKMFEKQVPLA